MPFSFTSDTSTGPLVDVLTEITIQRPIEMVAAYAADPTHAPEWYAKIRSVQWETPPPLGVGSLVAFVAQFLGRTLSYTYEVAEYLPSEVLVMRGVDAPFPMETTYRWHRDGPGRTQMTVRNRGVPSGFSRFTAPFMTNALRRSNRSDLQRLKSILEIA